MADNQKNLRKLFVMLSICCLFTIMFVSCPQTEDLPIATHTHSYMLQSDGQLKCSGCNQVIDSNYIAIVDSGNVVEKYSLLNKSNTSIGLSVNGDDITYVNTSGTAKKVAIYTLQNQNLTVNAPLDDVIHYGEVNSVDIVAVADNSYHGKARVTDCITVSQGKIDLEKDVPKLKVEATGKVSIVLEEDADIDSLTLETKSGTETQNIRISGEGSVEKLETKTPVTIETEVDEITVKSTEVSITLSGNAEVKEIIVDSSVEFTETNKLEIVIEGSEAEIESIVGLDSSAIETTTDPGVTPQHIHTYSFAYITWTDFTAKAVYKCSNDASHTESHDCTVTSAVTQTPTCVSTGIRTYTASYDGHTSTKEEILAKTDHSYGEPTWSWNADYTVATATFICTADSSHKQTVSGTVTSQITTKATCTEKGTRTFTAQVTFNSKEYTDTKTQDISALGHDYQYSSIEWTDFTAKAIYKCSNDASHTESHDCTVTSAVTKTATSSNSGIKTYTATYDGHSDTKTEILPATPVINPNGGTFTDMESVTITCVTDGVTIYYTLDGTTPTTSSTKYSGSFNVTEDGTIVKAIAVNSYMTSSEVASSSVFNKNSEESGSSGQGGQGEQGGHGPGEPGDPGEGGQGGHGPGESGDPGEGGQGGQGGGSSSSVVYTAANTITSQATKSNETYSSNVADTIALLINTDDDVTITNPTVTKSGDSDGGDNCNFYGQNASLLVKGGSTTTITGGTVTSSATGANGVFSYGGNGGTNGAAGDGTTVIIKDTVINTTGSGSGGIMTTGGGVTSATNLTITTSGGSSAAIRTDRGGGTVTVNKGTYSTSGLGSPAIYSTADITVSNATLTSTQSEGVCIEGKNSITLNNCSLTANNSQRNGNAKFLDTIMIYQSMSGDADSGTSSFSMTGGSLTSKSGHVFHITNTTAVINLNNVTITNNDSSNILLSVCDDGWSGASNIATLNAENQTLTGTILVGSNSTLTLNLTEGSTFEGTISGVINNASGDSVSSTLGTVTINVASGCTCTLTDTSGITINKAEDQQSGSGIVITDGYVEFGSYPQTEIVSQASDCGLYGKSFATEDDYIVDATLYNTLKNLSDNQWDSNGDTTVDGNKYRRIKKSDATCTSTTDNYYSWASSDTYHYFKFEPIKWRVLEQDDDEVLLLAETVLDDRMINTNITGTLTWETSTMRSWLNGYDNTMNEYGTDFSGSNFIDTAFTASEQAKIQTTTIDNDDNINHCTEGGNDTNDKIFLLSEEELYGDEGAQYGFNSNYNTEDSARRSISSTYAKAMGTESSETGYCNWWMRSPGSYQGLFCYVRESGSVYRGGQHANSKRQGVRPALYLAL